MAWAERRSVRTTALVISILAISTASILARLSDAPPFFIGAFRLLLASLLLAPWGLPAIRKEWHVLTTKDKWLMLGAATALAAHFATWFASLDYTTVASSVILVTTTPIYVGLVSHFFLGQRVSRGKAIAIAIAMVGSVIVSYGDFRLSGTALLGDLLAVLGALCIGANFMIADHLRKKLSTMAYVWPTYGTAGLILLICCVVMGIPVIGYNANTYLMVILMALGPQIIGHSLLNWSLSFQTPVMVTLTVLGEPIGSSVLAWIILNEIPVPAFYFGSILILAGIYVAGKEENAAVAAAFDDGVAASHQFTGDQNER